MLCARLLGPLEVELDGAVIDSPPSQRPWALFAYLALAPRRVPRAELAARFWPDVRDESARASLRSALWALRRRLGDALLVGRDGVELGGADGVWIDAREFDRLAGERPEEALALCRGELLEGLEDEWALTVQARHREREIALLEELAQRHEGSGELRQALELSRRQLDRDPLDEEAERRLMARLAAVGDRAAAVRSYRAFASRLRRELGMPPSPVTRELAERLRGEPAAPVAATNGPPAAGLLRLVGRGTELAALERVWEGVVAGSGAVALIRGEAGIGKTRLAAELRAQVAAGGGRAAGCAALDLGGAAPLSLWAELIRELLPGLRTPPAEAAWPEDLAVLASELPAHFAREGPPSAPVAPDLQRTRLYEAVVALVAWATHDRPLLLSLEDVHSADAPSLELAGYVSRRLASQRVMVLITRRGLPPSPDADLLELALRARGLLACELELAPLPRRPLALLVREAARLSEVEVQRVVERADGSPLLAVETARALERGEADVAQSLRGVVRATVARLGDDGRKLVELAAIAARPVAAVELAQLPLHDAEGAAAEALESGLLAADGGRVGFRHALLREAVYQEIAEPRRRGLHHRWAQLLLTGEPGRGVATPAEVARQLLLAGADADAVPQLAGAAAAARGVGALEEAVAFLHEALAIAPTHADLWLELGELEAWRGRRDEAECAFRRALELLETSESAVAAGAWLRRARAYHGPICVPRAVLESAQRALELLDRAGQPTPGARSEAIAALAWAEAVAGDVEAAEQLLGELGAAGEEDDDLRTYDVGHARALALMRRGRFVESYAPSVAAGVAIARAGRPDLAYGCWANAAGAAAAGGDHGRALEFIGRGMRAVEGHGLQSLELHLLAARAFVLRSLGRLDEAWRTAEAEWALAERLGQQELVAMASHDRGLIALEQGDAALAAGLLEAAIVDGAPISRPLTRLALAETLALAGETDRAAQQLRATVLEPVRASDFPETLVPRLARVQALIALAGHNREEARRRIDEAIAGWERLLERTRDAETMTVVLADLGRPVVGLIEPRRELARALADRAAIVAAPAEGMTSAVVP